jgi:outer membrane receptor for ferrienterochelin and colicin
MLFLRRCIAIFLLAFAWLPAPASAQAPTGSINGALVAQTNGLAVAGATVTLYRDSDVVATTTSDADGRYAFANEPAGTYSVVISAPGYASTRIGVVAVKAASTTTINTPLLASQTLNNSQHLREIGSTTSTGIRGSSLSSSSTIQTNLDPSQLQKQGFLNGAYALGQVPGVNLAGGPHSVGDDVFIDIRGMGQGEVRPLIDGHPAGPIGVFSTDYYDYANSPYSLLQNIQVTAGSGASGLYGVDVIGGTIDFQTLNPTATPQADAEQIIGTQGTLNTIVKSTGRLGRFGWAVGHTVMGTYGDFAPQLIFQSGRPNNNLNLANGGACTASNDLTSCNAAINTYLVSGNYKVLNDLAKIRYNFTPSTALTLTAYSGNTREDSTGNGDNDYLPYGTRLAQIQANATPNCNGGTGYTVITDSNPAACYSAQQWAAASSGPFGGGENRNRGTTLQDFDATFTTNIGINAISLSTFSDYYNFHKYSQAASGLDPTGTFLVGSGTFTDNYLTHGFLVTDDIAGKNNDLGFGYFIEHQQTYGNNLVVAPDFSSVTFVPQATLGEGDYSFFLRDNYEPTSKLALFLNAWYRYSSVTNRSTLDPRLSVVLKPTHRDVVRLTGGEADGDPSITIVNSGAISGVNNPSSLNPTCNPNLLNAVASAGNPSLTSERAKDIEAGYGHRFWDDTAINVVGYVSSVSNQIFQGTFPITPAALANPAIAGELGGFASKINSACGTSFTSGTIGSRLGLSGYFNASNALFRGLEISGRIRATKQLALDYVYDVQSSQQFGEPYSILINNPYVLDGGQIIGIPLQKASATLDYTNRAGGLEAQVAGYYTGVNNTWNRQPFAYFNGFVTKQVTKGIQATFSVYNMFENAVQYYGYFGAQVPHATNQFYTGPGDAVGQAITNGFGTQNELFGIGPRAFSFDLSTHI